MSKAEAESLSPETISEEYLAKLCGCTTRWLRQLRNEKHLPECVGRAEYRTEDVIMALLKYYRERSEGTRGTLAEEKLAKLKADRQLAEVKLAKERNTVADIESVEDFLKRAAAALDLRMTHELETVLPPALTGKDIVGMRQELQAAGDRIRDTLRRGVLGWKPE